ncbi:hypothetical protein ILUMI_26423 [Ignelater luminosus]|uniref:Uncharacterized protein n=1 Tax=Ignelater luminosus TaxID=2038154 RepID=A0A8K0FXD9_IGNLU|nr:hypothetical protein ILUMI_26423 [Ignelater luminosus]
MDFGREISSKTYVSNKFSNTDGACLKITRPETPTESLKAEKARKQKTQSPEDTLNSLAVKIYLVPIMTIKPKSEQTTKRFKVISLLKYVLETAGTLGIPIAHPQSAPSITCYDVIDQDKKQQKCSTRDGQPKKLLSNLCANDKEQDGFSESAPCITVTDNSDVIEETSYDYSSNEGPNSIPQPLTGGSIIDNELNVYEDNSDDDPNWEPSVDDTTNIEEPSGYYDSVVGNSNSTPSLVVININENQADTCKGMSYKTMSNKFVPPRSLKKPCGDKCRLNCSKKVLVECRLAIKDNYWKLGDISRQKEFVARHVSKNILAITDRMIQTTIAKTQNGFLSETRRGKHGKQRKLDSAIKESIRKHIESFPRIVPLPQKSNEP